MSGATLSAYCKKRDFKKTPEPSGTKKKKGKRPRFVVQKHDATKLHYDFRLEIDGALASWAVPKGPSLDPREKRLAVPTEDHPLDYASFEGTIPKGDYGGGTVMIWDRGTYRNLKEDEDGKRVPMKRCHRNGHITVKLYGKKLRGGFSLVRTGKGQDARWLLVKMDDDDADARRNPVSSEPKSVKSDRTLNEISRDEKKRSRKKKRA